MYLALKLVHIASVIAFLGNIVTGLFWHAHAMRTKDARILAHTMDGIIRSDRWFTNPGVVGIVVAGVALAMHAHLPILRTPWIAGTLALITLSGLAFGFRVAPLQRQLRALATQGTTQPTFDFTNYKVIAHRWEAWGAFALVTPLLGLVLMVLKPGQ